VEELVVPVPVRVSSWVTVAEQPLLVALHEERQCQSGGVWREQFIEQSHAHRDQTILQRIPQL
jgi:hypothetical protein